MAWASEEWQRSETVGHAIYGTALTDPGLNVTHTKGAWTQLVASTAFDAEAILIHLDMGNAGDQSILADLAIGASTAEKVIAGDMYVAARTNHIAPSMLPIPVPAGTRLAGRFQKAAGAVFNARMAVTLFGRPLVGQRTLSRVVAYGALTATTEGTAVDAGSNNHTKGAYAQLVASTGIEIRALVMMLGNGGNFALTGGNFLVDIAVGAGGAEVDVLSNLYIGAASVPDLFSPTVSPLIPCAIPAGSRLAARCQSSVINATDRVIYLVLYGLG